MTGLPQRQEALLAAVAGRAGLSAADLSAMFGWPLAEVRGSVGHLVRLGLMIAGGASNRRLTYALTDAGRRQVQLQAGGGAGPERPRRDCGAVRVYLAGRASEAPARVSLPAEPWGVL